MPASESSSQTATNLYPPRHGRLAIMSGDAAVSTDSSPSTYRQHLTRASAALVVAGIPFYVGGLLIIRAETPPSLSPTLGMLSHALWALAIVILSLGVASLLRWVDALRAGIAGYLSAVLLGLGVLHGLQWVTWAYVDVRAAREGEHELVVDAIIVPFGAGHLLMYCILLGSAIALLGWALRRTTITHSSIGVSGIVLGTLTAVLATISLVAAFGGGSEGHLLFDIATLLLPIMYLWVMALGIDIYRRR